MIWSTSLCFGVNSVPQDTATGHTWHLKYSTLCHTGDMTQIEKRKAGGVVNLTGNTFIT